ncbi:MAG: LolA-related protein [Rudaea sp.]
MISGIVLLSSLLLAANPPLPARAESVAPATAALIASLRRPAPAHTPYTEVRFVHMLQKPLVLRGQLHYDGARRLGKRVDDPYSETTTIADGEVTVVREGKSPKHFSLERVPELQALLASFGALLGGDATLLNQYFSIGLERTGENWRLMLTPRAPLLAKQLHDMVVDGSETNTRCFTLHEADGDSSVIVLATTIGTKAKLTPALVDLFCRGGEF